MNTGKMDSRSISDIKENMYFILALSGRTFDLI